MKNREELAGGGEICCVASCGKKFLVGGGIMTNWRDMAERVAGKAPVGLERSPGWRPLRDMFLFGQRCAVCGGKKKLVAHHRIPFHLAPDLELDVENLIPLCEAGRFGLNCHLLIGHVGRWQSTNVNIDADIAYWKVKLGL